MVAKLLAEGISDAELARRSGYDRSAISKWRRGVPPTLNAFLAVAYAAGFYIRLRRIDEPARLKSRRRRDVVKITTENP
jgi:transcriptional regulator with XRE-family HTH domain